MGFWILQSLNGIAYGMLLFLLASGLSLILGLMRIANLSHGAYYLVGSYVGLSTVKATGQFVLGVLSGGAAAAVLGILTERGLFRWLRGKTLQQVLLSVGVAFILGDVCLVLWGGDPQVLDPPRVLSGSIDLGITFFPIYRFFIVAVGAVVAALLWYLQECTRVGAIIRAGVDDIEMAQGLGANIDLVFFLVFTLGSFLAGAAGVLGLPFLGVYPGLDWEVLPLTLVVIIVGGAGSLWGALLGSLVIGLLDNLGRALFPNLSHFTLFVPMAVILAFRPSGLLGRR